MSCCRINRCRCSNGGWSSAARRPSSSGARNAKNVGSPQSRSGDRPRHQLGSEHNDLALPGVNYVGGRAANDLAANYPDPQVLFGSCTDVLLQDQDLGAIQCPETSSIRSRKLAGSRLSYTVSSTKAPACLIVAAKRVKLAGVLIVSIFNSYDCC